MAGISEAQREKEAQFESVPARSWDADTMRTSVRRARDTPHWVARSQCVVRYACFLVY